MENVRGEVGNVKIVDTDFPKYKNTYQGYEDVYVKYYERMPYIFCNDDISKTYYVPTDKELLQLWNYTIQNYENLYDFFDNYRYRFIECCPVELKCEVVSTVTDEDYVLDRFQDLFQYENKDLIRKTIFYCLIKFI